jgi:hypothetical protein
MTPLALGEKEKRIAFLSPLVVSGWGDDIYIVTRIWRSGMGIRGRPKLPPDRKRSRVVSIRFRESDYVRFGAGAKAAGKSVAEWAREQLLRAARF